MFIAFEGIDGSGKTTQAKLLFKYLRSKGKCLFTDEPTKGLTGVYIHGLLMTRRRIDPLALQLLFTADRAEHVNEFIIPKLKAGYSIITDRYMFSTIAYGMAGGIAPEMLISANSQFPAPDATLVIDTAPKTAVERLKKRGNAIDYFEKLNFLTKARDAYRSLARRYPNYFLIDGSGTIEETSDKIIKIISELQSRKGR